MSADDPGFRPIQLGSDFGLPHLTLHWQAAFDTADAALRAAAFDLAPAEVGRRRQSLVAEEATTLGLLRSFAREHLVSPAPQLYFGPVSPPMLGLPSSVAGCVFELDGVLANSIAAHRAAWAETFDGFLLRRSTLTSHEVMPYDPYGDYAAYIDGRPRLEGVRELLGSRGISLEAGAATNPPDAETVHGLANHKQAALQSILSLRGVGAFASSWQYLAAARHAGLRRAVVSVSEHTGAMLDLSGLTALLDAIVDGEVIGAELLQISPEPDAFLAAALRVGIEPARTAAFVHGLAGVSAARAGGFGYIVGIERSGLAARMLERGADRVVRDLAELMGRGLTS